MVVNSRMVKSNAIAGIESEPELRHKLVKVLTGEECSLQKFAIELHNDACLGCYIPGSTDNEHASPENSPMSET